MHAATTCQVSCPCSQDVAKGNSCYLISSHIVEFLVKAASPINVSRALNTKPIIELTFPYTFLFRVIFLKSKKILDTFSAKEHLYDNRFWPAEASRAAGLHEAPGHRQQNSEMHRRLWPQD